MTFFSFEVTVSFSFINTKLKRFVFSGLVIKCKHYKLSATKPFHYYCALLGGIKKGLQIEKVLMLMISFLIFEDLQLGENTEQCL